MSRIEKYHQGLPVDPDLACALRNDSETGAASTIFEQQLSPGRPKAVAGPRGGRARSDRGRTHKETS